MDIGGYIEIAKKFASKNVTLGPVALDILELFVEKESLSAYQIFSCLNERLIKMAYKNVHKRVRRLLALNLIAEKKAHNTRHGAKYYKLTEEGIYQLFLRRIDGFLVNQTAAKSGKPVLSNVETFLRYYNDSALLESFLYPYFERRTLLSSKYDLLWDLFLYLHDCCKELGFLADANVGTVPIIMQKFSWNRVPGLDRDKFLTSLNEIFDLDNTDRAEIKKINDQKGIMVTTSDHHILLKIDRRRRKVTATFDNNDSRYEYEVLEFGSDLIVGVATNIEQSMKKRFDNDRSLIETPVYKLVTYSAMINSDNLKTLSQDSKFMRVVEDMFNKFKRGYDTLMDLRIAS